MSEVVTIGNCTLYHGDCMEVLDTLQGDVVVTDPPYGVTSLAWDKRIEGWTDKVQPPALWCFGSLRFFLAHRFDGWTYAQDIVWEKHNGSNFHADRFRRVHEFAVMFYRGPWGALHRAVPVTADATKRTVRRKKRPVHTGHIEASTYASEDGGPRLQRSVIKVSSCHGYADHPTQKPVGIVSPLIEYSCPPTGTVIDPFMGSGTAGVAVAHTGRKFIGVELNRAYFDIACERIAQAQAQQWLFA